MRSGFLNFSRHVIRSRNSSKITDQRIFNLPKILRQRITDCSSIRDLVRKSRPSRRDPAFAISSILCGLFPEGEFYLFRVVQERHAPLRTAKGVRASSGEQRRAAVGQRCKDLCRKITGYCRHGTAYAQRDAIPKVI